MRIRDCGYFVPLVLFTISNSISAATGTRTVAFDYDANGRVTKEIVEPTDSNLCLVQVYTYDVYGHITKGIARNCDGSTGSVPATNSEAAAPSWPAAFTTRSSQTEFADPRFASRITNAAGHPSSFTYYAGTSHPLTTTDANGKVTSWAYDALLRPTLVRFPDGNGIHWTYEYCNGFNGGSTACPTSVNGIPAAYVLTETPVANVDVGAKTYGAQIGPYIRVYYDSLDREIRTETQGFDGAGPAPIVVKDTDYDRQGRVVRKSRPYIVGAAIYWTSYSYDTIGRVSREDRPDGSYTTWSYDGTTDTRRVAAVSAPTTYSSTVQTTVEKRNALGQVVSIIDAQSNVTTRYYDPYGNLAKTVDPVGNTVSMVFDARGRRTQLQDPDLGSMTFVFDAANNLLQQTDANNKTIKYNYDALGRMTRWQGPDLTANKYYDKYSDSSPCPGGIGRLCESNTDGGYSSRLSYDALGRPSGEQAYIGKTLASTLTYNALGRVDTVTYPNGFAVRYGYTNLGNLLTIKNAITGASYWTAGAMDAEGHLTDQIFGNGLHGAASFDPATGRTTALSVGGGAVHSLSYSYDWAGNIRTRSDTVNGVSATFDYDDLNRLKVETRSGGALTSAQTIGWTYDSTGNITSRSDIGTYSYPTPGSASVRPHAVTSIAGTVNYNVNPTFTYDNVGNMMSGLGRQYSWTSFNKPAQILSGTSFFNFQYGPNQELIKTVDNITTNVRLIAPSGGVFYEENSTSTAVSQISYLRLGARIIGYASNSVGQDPNSSAAVRYYHSDSLGSVEVVTDSAGAVIERHTYEPFGKYRNPNGNTDLGARGGIPARFAAEGFTGQETYHGVYQSLMNMNGRFYDAAIGRFISADPLIQDQFNGQSYNRYAYVLNNPLRYVDPSGFESSDSEGAPAAQSVTITGSKSLSATSSGDGHIITYCPGSCDPKSFVGLTVNGQPVAPLSFDPETGCQKVGINDGDELVPHYRIEITARAPGHAAAAGSNAADSDGATGGIGAGPGSVAGSGAAASVSVGAHAGAGAGSGAGTSGLLTSVQLGLAAVSMVPGLNIPAGAISAAIDLAQGDYLAFGLSVASMVPFGGEVAAAGRAEMALAKLGRTLERCLCCFVAGTPVLTETGPLPIEQVKVGMLVQSRDEQSGQTSLKPVTDVIRNEGREIFGLTFVNSAGKAIRVEVSDNHPFWVLRSGWIDSARLQPGMRVSTFQGDPITVVHLERLGRTEPTYNLTVGDFHTFFAGEGLAYVHNTCACGAGARGAAKAFTAVKATAANYAKLFRKARPDFPKGWPVHHSLPQRYEELMLEAGINIHDIEFLRGVEPELHQLITEEWGRFHKAMGGNPTAAQVADFAKQIDIRFGDHFVWPGF